MDRQIAKALYLLRISIFIVMLFWTLDKIMRPEHAMLVFQSFYYISNLSPIVMQIIGGLEMLLILAFLLGVQKTLTYGLVFLLHFISTVASYKVYLTPFESNHLLFFAAIPMLAACYALFTLRYKDTIMVIDRTRRERNIF